MNLLKKEIMKDQARKIKRHANKMIFLSKWLKLNLPLIKIKVMYTEYQCWEEN